VPLLTAATVRRLMAELERGAAAVLLTAILDDGGPYGRVLRDPDARCERWSRHATPTPRSWRCARSMPASTHSVGHPSSQSWPTGADNVQGEYYLTDVVAALRDHGLPVAAVTLDDRDEMRGINTRSELAAVARVINQRLLAGCWPRGSPWSTLPPPGWRLPSSIGRDVMLEPG